MATKPTKRLTKRALTRAFIAGRPDAKDRTGSL
jgi:hypothetical protein